MAVWDSFRIFSLKALIPPGPPTAPDWKAAPDFSEKIARYFPRENKKPEAASENIGDGETLRILLLDLSLLFSRESEDMLYDMVEEPLGLMYLMTYLNKTFGSRVHGKIAKSRVDFDSFDELRALVSGFKPDLIGIRTLSFYREFFHKAVLTIRQWSGEAALIAGGPYASSDYRSMLQDLDIDLAVLGEGEKTLGHLVEKMLENRCKLPGEEILRDIPGIAYLENN